jgi:hypothetical protein
MNESRLYIDAIDQACKHAFRHEMGDLSQARVDLRR